MQRSDAVVQPIIDRWVCCCLVSHVIRHGSSNSGAAVATEHIGVFRCVRSWALAVHWQRDLFYIRQGQFFFFVHGSLDSCPVLITIVLPTLFFSCDYQGHLTARFERDQTVKPTLVSSCSCRSSLVLVLLLAVVVSLWWWWLLLGCHLSDHLQTLDVLAGELRLSDVALLPRRLGAGRVEGGAAAVVARWSWRRLLTEAVQLEISDLKLSVRPAALEKSWRSGSGGVWWSYLVVLFLWIVHVLYCSVRFWDPQDSQHKSHVMPPSRVFLRSKPYTKDPGDSGSSPVTTDTGTTVVSERNYVERLKRKIMDQLELRVTNAHICLEGQLEDDVNTFRAGLMFDHFGIHPVSDGKRLRCRWAPTCTRMKL